MPAQISVKLRLNRAMICALFYHLENRPLWLNQIMFARRVRIECVDEGKKIPCPLKWLDSFSMRNFTNASVFDDTIPVADGQMEIGARVPINQLGEAMEDWFRLKGYLGRESKLSLAEILDPAHTHS